MTNTEVNLVRRVEVFECRACGYVAEHQVFLSLGSLPLGNSLVTQDRFAEPDPIFPLELAFCEHCSLVQVQKTLPFDELIEQNLYFSSISPSRVRYGEKQAQRLIESRRLNEKSLVVEIGSNDGTFLKYFRDRNIQVLGIEPIRQSAELGEREYGVTAVKEIFTEDLAQRLKSRGIAPDVIIANSVLELVPELSDFVRAIHTLLTPNGIATIEVPYVRTMIEQCRFDGVAHLHLSWFSATSLDRLFGMHGLSLIEAEHLPEFRGGTLRFSVSKLNVPSATSTATMLRSESELGLNSLGFYQSFAQRVYSARGELRAFLTNAKMDQHKRIAAYGAGIKASTLLNFVGLNGDIIDFVVDGNPYKQGRYVPGVRLPVHPPQKLIDAMPAYTLLLALDFTDEILAQQEDYRRRGGMFVVPVPKLKVV